MILTPGNVHDVSVAHDLLMNAYHLNILLDKGYESKELRNALYDQNCVPHIPQKSNAVHIKPYDQELYRARPTIERTFGFLKENKRIALTCFEANICQCHRKHLAEAIENLPGFEYRVEHI
jgi:transposase